MLGYNAIVHVYFLNFLVFSFKARRGLQRQNCSWQNSAQANTARSRTLRSVSLHGVLRGTILSLQASPCFE